MIAKDKPIEAGDFNNDLVGIKEETEPRINTETVPAAAQYNYYATLIESRTGDHVLYTTSNIQDSGGVVSNSEESGPSKDLVKVSDFRNSIATKAPSSHNHSLSDVREFAGWSITQNSSKDIVFKVRSPKSWTEVLESKFDTTSVLDICYGNGKFVAVGSSGKMAYSTDAVSWTEVVESKFGTSTIYGVCYGNGKFVAVGDSGKIAYSIDGIDWIEVTDSTFGSNTTIYSICYGNGKFVAGGGYLSSIGLNDYIPNGRVAYSIDGVTWTSIDSSPFRSCYIYSICYGNGKYIAAGGRPSTTIEGTTVGASGKMVYSTDGTTWTAVTNPHFETSQIRSICYGNGKFVAGGESGKMAHSEVGTGWTEVVESKFGTSTIYGVCHGNGKFVAVGQGGKVAYSSDGIRWTEVTVSAFGDRNIRSVCYGNGKFVAVGAGGKITYSKVFH